MSQHGRGAARPAHPLSRRAKQYLGKEKYTVRFIHAQKGILI